MNQGERTVSRIKAFHVYAEIYAECIMYAEMKKSKNIFSGEAREERREQKKNS